MTPPNGGVVLRKQMVRTVLKISPAMILFPIFVEGLRHFKMVLQCRQCFARPIFKIRTVATTCPALK
jgi:hypothetical protein